MPDNIQTKPSIKLHHSARKFPSVRLHHSQHLRVVPQSRYTSDHEKSFFPTDGSPGLKEYIAMGVIDDSLVRTMYVFDGEYRFLSKVSIDTLSEPLLTYQCTESANQYPQAIQVQKSVLEVHIFVRCGLLTSVEILKTV